MMVREKDLDEEFRKRNDEYVTKEKIFIQWLKEQIILAKDRYGPGSSIKFWLRPSTARFLEKELKDRSLYENH